MAASSQWRPRSDSQEKAVWDVEGFAGAAEQWRRWDRALGLMTRESVELSESGGRCHCDGCCTVTSIEQYAAEAAGYEEPAAKNSSAELMDTGQRQAVVVVGVAAGGAAAAAVGLRVDGSGRP